GGCMKKIAPADDLAAVRGDFERWRSSHRGRRRIPDRLWRRALVLLDRYAPTRVCRELGLNSARLAERRRAADTGAVSTSSPSTFVEVRASSLPALASPRARHAAPASERVRVLVERTDGAR